MFIYQYKCKLCETTINDNFKLEDYNINWNIECQHFLTYYSVKLKNNKFDKILTIFNCKNCLNCQNSSDNIFYKIPNSIKYTCDNCKNELIFQYMNEQRYVTPDNEDEEKINIRFVYNFDIYNRVVNPKEKIEYYLLQLKNELNFSDKAIILYNNTKLDMSKSFYENHLTDGIKIEISDN